MNCRRDLVLSFGSYRAFCFGFTARMSHSQNFGEGQQQNKNTAEFGKEMVSNF